MTKITNAPAERMPSAILAAARGWLGTPYQHQASVKGVGCDCLGLLRGVWRELYGDEPEDFRPYSPNWAETGTSEELLEAARRHLVQRPNLEISPSAVLIFRWRTNSVAKHCGIASGPMSFIHAHDGASVAEVALVPQWRRRLVAVFDFPDRGM